MSLIAPAIALHSQMPFQPRKHVFDQPLLQVGSVSSRPHHMPESIDVRDDPPRHQLAVPFPILAVLPSALLLVSPLTVDKEDGKVQHEEVCEDHAPALRLAGYGVLAIRVLEENGV